MEASQCVGYAKSKKRRCGVQLRPDQEAGSWWDPATGSHGGPLDEPPRCQYHPPSSDPDSWNPSELDPPAGETPPAREPIGPDRQLPERSIPRPTPELDQLEGIPEAGPDTDRPDLEPDLDDLDRIAGEILGDGGDPSPGPEAPEAAPGGAGDTGGAAPEPPEAPAGPLWTGDEIAAILGWLNPILERMGADPVPPDELAEGGRLLAKPADRLLRRVNPETWLPLAWLGKTYGTRVIQAGWNKADRDQDPAPDTAGPSGSNGRPDQAQAARPSPAGFPDSWRE